MIATQSILEPPKPPCVVVTDYSEPIGIAALTLQEAQELFDYLRNKI
jgi:hypothetical protein